MATPHKPVHPKVQAAGAVGSFVVLVVFVADAFGLEVPPEVASALTVLATFAAGYLQRG